MNRRDALKLLLASASASYFDWEKLLWIPKPIITIPAYPIEVANRFIMYAGARGGGKTFLAMEMIKKFLTEFPNKTAAIVDANGTKVITWNDIQRSTEVPSIFKWRP